MLLENPNPSSICSIEDKVIEAKESDQGVSLISRQELVWNELANNKLPFRHCSLADPEDPFKAALLSSVHLQALIAGVEAKPPKRSVFSRRGTNTTEVTTLSSSKSVSFGSQPASGFNPITNFAKSNKVCFIVIDKTIEIDQRILIALLLIVFILFFLAIVLSVFLLSVYIWLN